MFKILEKWHYCWYQKEEHAHITYCFSQQENLERQQKLEKLGFETQIGEIPRCEIVHLWEKDNKIALEIINTLNY